MMYSQVDPLQNMKSKVFVHLGWWHPYKHANELLWKVGFYTLLQSPSWLTVVQKFLPTLLGPAFHCLFPKSKCRKSPRLTAMVYFFGQLTLAFKKSQRSFRALLSWAKKSPNLNISYDSHIKNLKLFFHFLLPAVCSLLPQTHPTNKTYLLKVRDYGALLKLAKFSDCLLALKRLLLVFITLAPTGMYSKAVLLYLILLQHWDEHFPDVAKIWKQHLPAFIEEDGELSFSVLSRTVLGDTSKSSFNVLNKAYKSQHLYKEAMADLEKDLNCFTRTASLHTILDEESSEVKQLSQFLEQHFRSLQKGTLEIYSKLGSKGLFYPATTEKEAARYHRTLVLEDATVAHSSIEVITQFEPLSLQDCLEETLNSLEKTLLEQNFAGCEVKYILLPQDLESEATCSSE